jgi:hypothetical protein
MTIDSVVAMGFSKDAVGDLRVNVVERLNDANPDLTPALMDFQQYFGESINTLPNDKYTGFCFVDGLSNKEEIILDKLGDSTNIFFSGGSAADSLGFKRTFIHSNGIVYEDAALIAIFQMNLRFSFAKIQSARDTGKRLVATKVDECKRIVYEFDNKPAANVFSELTGIPVDEISNRLMDFHLALVIDGQPFLRSVTHCYPDKSLRTACSIKKNMPLTILKTEDNILSGMKEKLGNILHKHPKTMAMLTFGSIYRHLYLLNRHQFNDYADIFKEIPTVGCSTLAEYYIGLLNNTATFVIFEED